MAAYKAALREAQRDLDKAQEERAKLERKIIRLRQTVSTLTRLMAGDNPSAFPNVGLTDAIRTALRNSPIPLPVKGLREAMEVIGYDFSRHENALASIAGTVERLVMAGEVRRVRLKNPKTDATVSGYEWIRKTEADQPDYPFPEHIKEFAQQFRRQAVSPDERTDKKEE